MGEINRNATGSIFGWDFQINTAILLFLRDYENTIEIRVEGQNEDIEIYKDNTATFVQAKSNEIPDSYNNVSEKYKKALLTLYESDKKVANCDCLIFAVNYDKPLGADQNYFNNFAYYAFNELPPKSKDKIVKYVQAQGWTDFHYDKLHVLFYFFSSSDFQTRYRYILEQMRVFLSRLQIQESYADEVLMIWQQILLHNASSRPLDLTVQKSDLIWTLIVQLLNKTDTEWLDNEMDEALYEDVETRYRSLIKYCENQIKFCFDVMYDYNNYEMDVPPKEKTRSFVNNKWQDYVDRISQVVNDPQEQEMVIKKILYTILNNHRKISRIKDATKLS